MNKEGKRLAEVVKRTHKKLRKRYKQGEDETQLWQEHIQQQNELQTYASAMHELATTHWEATQQVNTSRVLWTYNAIKQYFNEGELQRITEKEMRKLKHLELEEAESFDPVYRFSDSSKIKLLDVGSCYNPFSAYEDLDVTAVDLCPALESVKQCDFLSLQIRTSETKASDEDDRGIVTTTPKERAKRTSTTSLDEVCHQSEIEQLNSVCKSDVKRPSDSKETDDLENHNLSIVESTIACDQNKSKCETRIKDIEGNAVNCLSSLESNSYDVVVFCLFLEYIPSPKQRFQCCEKAYNLLKPNGILCIITPDSKHQNANVHIYKLWKITLGFLGFSRTKYEKQTHFHGMVFRKGLCKKAWELDAEREMAVMKKTQVKSKFANIDYEKVCTEIYIPQDFQDFSESEEEEHEKE